jgi:hypothetical protein
LILFMNFDGVSLTMGTDEASTNTSTIVTAPIALPPYLDGAADRQTRIDAIATATRTRLAPYDVELVTARPADAGYAMIVVSGDSKAVAGASGVSALVTNGCAGADPHGIAFLFQSSASADVYGPELKANLVLAMVGFEHQLPPTSKAGDCMCFAATSCTQPEKACTVGAAGTTVDTANACSGAPSTIDEGALFTAALGTHP